MKSSNLLVAFAAIGSVMSGAALADDKVATAAASATPPDMVHVDDCNKEKEILLSESRSLRGNIDTKAGDSCAVSLKVAAHSERMIAFVRSCSGQLGLDDVQAGKAILQYALTARNLRDDCSP
ncbi:hypothetical protein [Hyphomicrobium sp.]|jgi:hypothetical protein|uniref:hypothetical protein n=1 Tax=Hyphomicrobium sp. TaxID=82 RepID=UPI003568DF47